MEVCPDKTVLIEDRFDRLLTQYRESPNLIAVIRHGLGQIADATGAICAVPTFFDIQTAVGDQLTLLGKRLGWPRCHCVCSVEPVFGFVCEIEDPNRPIVGLCEESWPSVWVDEWAIDTQGSWADCRENGVSDLCLDDDEVYRGYLLARRYQALQRYGTDDLHAAVRHLWGSNANVFAWSPATIVVAPGRALTDREQREVPIALRVLPVAPGIRVRIHLGTEPLFGFGAGWSGFCEEAAWLCPQDVDPYGCT